jgi:hypothetical protein
VVPAVADKVFIKNKAVACIEADSVIKARDRLMSPPLVIDAPPVIYRRDKMPPGHSYRRRQAGGVFIDLHGLRRIYREVGISA